MTERKQDGIGIGTSAGDSGYVPRARRRLALVVVLVLWGLITHGTYAGSGDEPHYVAIAHSIAFDFDLDVGNNYGPNEPLIGEGGLAPEAHARPGTGGIIRPVHDVGLPMLFAPWVRVAAPFVTWSQSWIPPDLMRRARLNRSTLYRHLLSAGMMVVAALLALQLFEALRSTGTTAHAAFWIALLVALSPPLLIYSVLFFTEIVSALLVLIAFRLIAFRRLALVPNRVALAQVAQGRGTGSGDARDDGGAGQARAASTWSWAVAGAATGLLFLVHARNVGLVAALGLLALHRLWQERQRTPAAPALSALSALPGFAAFAAAAGALVLIRTIVNHTFWGSWITNPHVVTGGWPGLGQTMKTAATRLAGLLLDQEYGLLPYAPIFVLAGVGVIALARTNRRLFWQIALVTGVYLLTIALPVTNVHGWTGGWSPAARFLVPIVPLMALALAAGMRVTPMPLVAALVAVQIAIDAYSWQNPKNLWNDGDGIAAICQRSGASYCRYWPSFVGPGSGSDPR